MANTLPPNIFVKSAKIVDVHSPWNGQQVSLILERGKIKKLEKTLKLRTLTTYLNTPTYMFLLVG
jgi:hypothetical protein